MEFATDNIPDISFIDDSTIDEVMSMMIRDYQERYKELTGKEKELALADRDRLILYACAVQVYQAMQYVDFSGKMGLLKYSRDQYLDNLALLRGVKRMEATAAVTTMRFSIGHPIDSVVAIPEGTRVTNGNDVYFATDEYAEIAAGETSVSVQATCTVAGAAGNGFEAGEFRILVNTLPYIAAVSNTDKTSGGSDEEDDEKLRDRIYNAPGTYTTTGAEDAYKFHTKNVDSDIDDVHVERLSPGVVGVYFVCTGGELPSESLITKVSEYLMNGEIRPLTDLVVVEAPKTVQYDTEVTYYISSSDKSAVSKIQAAVENAATAYQAWQMEKIGRDIDPGELNRKIREAGAKRCVITSPVYMALNKDTIARAGNITITYGGLEDD